jgi:hypothetical protein
VADVVDIEGVDGGTLKVIRQEYSGMVSTHVTCDISIRRGDQCSSGRLCPGRKQIRRRQLWKTNPAMPAI